MLDKLLKNKVIKNAFMNQFKSIVKDEGLKYILITVKENGEIEPTLYKDEIKVLSITEYNNLINALKSQL